MKKDSRIKVEIFVSYAHKDDEYVDPFLDDFKDMVAPSMFSVRPANHAGKWHCQERLFLYEKLS